MSLLSIENLSVSFGQRRVVEDLNLTLNAGEKFALVGESGSGKSVTALSILRLLQDATYQGAIHYQGENLFHRSEKQMRQLRGKEIAMIFQEPMTALNPLFTIGNQIVESLALHEGLSPRAAFDRAVQLLARTGIAEPARRFFSYPHQLSGGQRQRAMIAMALACKPKLLLADEPTTALDVQVRIQILQLLTELQAEYGLAILLITHDLPLVKHFADRVGVMEQGKLIETAVTATLFSQPQADYTQKLLNSVPQRMVQDSPVLQSNGSDSDAPTLSPLLQVNQVSVRFPVKRVARLMAPLSWFGHDDFYAVQQASFSLSAGQTVGIVGESGSGKSTLAMAILGLQSAQAVSGRVAIKGQRLMDDLPAHPAAPQSEQEGSQQDGQHPHLDQIRRPRLDAKALRHLRQYMQVVFQDPFSSLSPRMTVEQIVGEGLQIHAPHLSSAQRRERVLDVLAEVGLEAARLDDVLSRYPHEFSGGQRQRIAIARVLILKPSLMVLDEPTSALDVSIQQQILALLARLQRDYQLSYILISHDLAVIRAMAHHVLVMQSGRIVEAGTVDAILTQPQQPYTQALVKAALGA